MFSNRLLLLACCLLSFSLRAQSTERANELYKKGEYAKAIPLYERAIAAKPSNAAKVKLANCYRVLNRPTQAAPIYAELSALPDAKPSEWMHYAECLMAAANYTEAATWVQRALAQQPDEPRALLLLQSCKNAATIPSFFPDIRLEPFAHNSNADENAATVYGNRLVFASDRSGGFGLMKQKSAGTGRDYLNVYASTQQENGTFSKPKIFSGALSELNKNVSNPSFTADGRRVYFSRNSDVPSKTEAYNLQLFTAETRDGRSWSNVERLAFCNPDNNYLHPAISPDGNTLYYVAERTDGLGGTDIYATVKNEKGKWSKAENLGWRINTAANEGFPFAAADGKLYFCSKGHAGLGGFDIFFSERDARTGDWTTPRNLGAPVNSPYDDISICVADSGRFGAFTSSRSERGDDIFLFSFADTVQLLAPIVFHNERTKKEKLSTSGKRKPKKVDKNVDNDTVVAMNVDNPTTERIKKSDDTPIQGKSDVPPLAKPVVLKTKKMPRDTPKTYIEQLKRLIVEHKLRVNKTFVMENVRYADSMGVEITPDIAVALDDLADILLAEKITVEIGAHTETVTDMDDKTLRERSQKRAEKAIEYLKERGVKEKYLTAKGYGRVRPLNNCREAPCDPKEDERNRRLELKIKAL